MRRRLFNLATDVSLGLCIGWFFLNMTVRMGGRYYCWGVEIPRQFLWLWLPPYSLLIQCLLFVLPACRLVMAALRRWMKLSRLGRSLSGYCPHCSYDLTGNISGVCPECGTPIEGQSATISN